MKFTKISHTKKLFNKIEKCPDNGLPLVGKKNQVTSTKTARWAI